MSITVRQTAEEFQLVETIALNNLTDRESVLLFDNLETFLAEILKQFCPQWSKFIASAPVISAIPIAADRADVPIASVFSKSPFAPDTNTLRKNVSSKTEVMYLANPNRLTGATYSNFQIKELARSLEDGILIVDEYYSDFSGLSSLPLTGILPNLIILKSLDNWQSIARTECGYAIISEELIGRLDTSFNNNKLNRASAKKSLEIFTNSAANTAIKEIQKEMLVTATALTNLGLRCHITPTDSIAIYADDLEYIQKSLGDYDIITEVAHFTESGNKLIRYRISTPEKNRLLEQALMKVLAKKSNKPASEAVPA